MQTMPEAELTSIMMDPLSAESLNEFWQNPAIHSWSAIVANKGKVKKLFQSIDGSGALAARRSSGWSLMNHCVHYGGTNNLQEVFVLRACLMSRNTWNIQELVWQIIWFWWFVQGCLWMTGGSFGNGLMGQNRFSLYRSFCKLNDSIGIDLWMMYLINMET